MRLKAERQCAFGDASDALIRCTEGPLAVGLVLAVTGASFDVRTDGFATLWLR